MIRSFLKDAIIVIAVSEESLNPWYTWKSRQSIFGAEIRAEGFYEPLCDEPSKLPENTVAKGEKAYHKPSVMIQLADGSKHRKYFDTIKQALNEAERLSTYRGRWINDNNEWE